MPKRPRGERRLPDTHAGAIEGARIAVGEDEVPTAEDRGKNPAAVALGRIGGYARAKGLSAKRRKDIARRAA
jgi:hypothetical protein